MAKKKAAKDPVDEMVSDIVSELDYDLWKSLYHADCIEDPDGAEETRATLRGIAKQHIDGMRR
jgi:hypothetical protein